MTGDITGPQERAFFFTYCPHPPSYLNQLQPLQNNIVSVAVSSAILSPAQAGSRPSFAS